MGTTTIENKKFASWAAQTYETKKEAVDFMEINVDIFEKALATLIKKYAGGVE